MQRGPCYDEIETPEEAVRPRFRQRKYYSFLIFSCSHFEQSDAVCCTMMTTLLFLFIDAFVKHEACSSLIICICSDVCTVLSVLVVRR